MSALLAGESLASFLNPALDFLPTPDPAHRQVAHGYGKVWPGDELLNALPGDAQQFGDLGSAHDLIHDQQHTDKTSCALTSTARGGTIRSMDLVKSQDVKQQSPIDALLLDTVILINELGARMSVIDGSGTRERAFECLRLDQSSKWLMARVTPGSAAPFWHVAVAYRASGIAAFTEDAIHRELVVDQLAHFGVLDAAFKEIAGTETSANPYSGPKKAARNADTRTVYFIQAAYRGGPIKIGVAVNVARRLAAIQSTSPMELDVLGVIPGVGQPGEARLHRQFKAHRLHGEWFSPAPELLAYIDQHAK